jgi:ADP-ribosylation factor-like protein 5B
VCRTAAQNPAEQHAGARRAAGGSVMGVLMSRLWQRLFGPHQYKICLVGLNNAGKTTTLFKLHLGEVVETQPTIGSNVEEVVHDNVHFQVWDLGGQDSLRSAWSTYYVNTHAVILVVDSTDRKRIGVVTHELNKLLAHDDLKNAVLLVFANKQDCKEKMTAAQIAQELELHKIKDHAWHIQACCALTGDGLYEGIDWITQKVAKK